LFDFYHRGTEADENTEKIRTRVEIGGINSIITSSNLFFYSLLGALIFLGASVVRIE